MKKTSFAKVAKIAQINPKDVRDIHNHLANVMIHFDIDPIKWDKLSDEYILLLCEQYQEEVF